MTENNRNIEPEFQDDEIEDDVQFDEDGNPHYVMEPRSMDEVDAEVARLFDIVWWNRHKYREAEIEFGDAAMPPDDIWTRAKAAAKRIESEISAEDLDPGDDFHWGMVNGKFSALRWVLGYEWDFLDT